jgi:hypothetical protein
MNFVIQDRRRKRGRPAFTTPGRAADGPRGAFVVGVVNSPEELVIPCDPLDVSSVTVDSDKLLGRATPYVDIGEVINEILISYDPEVVTDAPEVSTGLKLPLDPGIEGLGLEPVGLPAEKSSTTPVIQSAFSLRRDGKNMDV